MIYRFGACELDTDSFVLCRDGTEVSIEPQVFAVLTYLVERRDRAVTKEELLDGVWGDQFVSQSALTSRIASLRAAVGDDGTAQAVVRTVHRHGYQFVADVIEAIEPVTDQDRQTSSSAVGADSTMTNLPVRSNDLVGRAEDIERLGQLLDRHRLITLAASGGIGKTRLAVAAGWVELERRPDGVWFVDLTELTDATSVAAAVAGALGLDPGARDARDAVLSYLADRNLLLILDNCEHLVQGCADLAEAIVARPGRSIVLATSRETLDVDGERVVRVTPLDTTDPAGTAFELFVQRATELDDSFHADAPDAEAIVELCRRLDGMPLAIELAAARTTVLAPTDLLAGLEDRFGLLHSGRRRRQRTLEATLDWSFKLLRPDEQEVFAALGIFGGTFDLAAAASVADMSAAGCTDVVESLIAKSLVVREPVTGPARFRLYETTAAFALDRLIEAGRVTDVRNRHLAHFGELAAQQYLGMYADLAARRLLERDRANLVAAFEWAKTCDNWTAASRLVLGSGALFHTALPLGVDLIDACLARLPDTEHDLAMRLVTQQIFLHILGYDGSRVHEGTTVLRASADPHHQVYGHALEGFRLVRYDRADGTSSLQRAIDLAETLPVDSDGLLARSAAHTLLGLVRMAEDRFDEALTHSGEGIAHHSALGFATEVLARALLTHSICALLSDQTELALQTADEYAELESGMGTGDEIRALAYARLGRLDETRSAIRAHAQIAVTGRLVQQATDSLLLIAVLYDAEGDRAQARRVLEDMGVPRQLGAYARHLATLLGITDRGDFDAPWRRDRHSIAARAARDVDRLRQEMEHRGW